jgi:hypothetical protein
MGESKELAKAYNDLVATQTVLIRRAYRDSAREDRECHGTGIIIGHGRGANNRLLKIATAGHVLDHLGDGQCAWELSRVEKHSDGHFEEISRTFSGGEKPHVICCEYLRNFDIGMLAIENQADGEPGRKFIDTEKHLPLKVSPQRGYLRPGNRVAWAGFPGFVRDITGKFQMCYFEGVLSAVSMEPFVYLVDGHSAPGVSGGPMWLCNEQGDPVIVGVCIDYRWPGDSLPGLAGFCPLGVLLAHVEQAAAKSQTTDQPGRAE